MFNLTRRVKGVHYSELPDVKARLLVGSMGFGGAVAYGVCRSFAERSLALKCRPRRNFHPGNVHRDGSHSVTVNTGRDSVQW